MEGAKSKKIPPISLVLWIGLVACTQQIPSIQQITFMQEGQILVQSTGPQIHQLGILSDIHGDLNQLDHLLARLQEEGVDGILIPGDLVLNEELRYGRPDKIEDTQELTTILEHVEKIHLPVWIIPGNHEGREIYEKAFNTTHTHLWDLTQFRFVDLNGVDIVSLPGYYIEQTESQRFLPTDGFFLSKEEIENVPRLIASSKKDRDPILLITHGPPLSTLERGIDVVPNIGHTGSEFLREMLLETNISFAMFGHIHEGGPQAENSLRKIEEGEWSDRLWLNSGAVAEGHATLLRIKENKASWIQIKG